MKILHVATGFKLSYPGGITNYVRSLARSQKAAGHEIHVLARPEEPWAAIEGITLKPYMPNKMVCFTMRNIFEDPATSALVELLQAERYDLVHFHMALDLPLAFLSDFSEHNIPYVVSLHDYSHICPRVFMFDVRGQVCHSVDLKRCRTCVGYLDQVDLLRRASYRIPLYIPRIPSRASDERLRTVRVFLESADRLLPVSSRTCDIYREVVPNGRFQIEQIGNDSATAEIHKKIPSEKVRVTALGTLNEMKGAGVLQKLMDFVSNPQIEFHFYGRAKRGWEKSLAKRNLICHGSYLPGDVPGIMAKSDIGLVLSIWEDSGPQVAMEFINHRVPVVGTRRGGIPDIVQSGHGMTFDPDNDQEMLAAANWISSSTPQSLAEISDRMNRLRTPEEHASIMMQVYVDVISSSNSGRASISNVKR